MNSSIRSLLRHCRGLPTSHFSAIPARPVRCFHPSTAVLDKQVVNVPAMGDSISEGTVVEFSKQVGERVEVDDVVVVLETDKVSVDVRSPYAGTLVALHSQLEDNIEVGSPLFSIDSDVAATVTSDSSTNGSPSASTETTPVPSNPAPASVPSPPSEQKGHRKPLIKFLGKRYLLQHPPAPQAAAGTAPATSSTKVFHTTEESTEKALFGRLPLSNNELRTLRLGFAE